LEIEAVAEIVAGISAATTSGRGQYHPRALAFERGERIG
jgi:hypothetical protein